MARGTSFARGLAEFMSCGVIWFEVGLVAILRVVLKGMQLLAWMLRVEEERSRRDILVLECASHAVIFFISLTIIATMFSEMGRFLHVLNAAPDISSTINVFNC